MSDLEPDAWQDSKDAYYTYPSKKHPAGEDKSHIKRFQPLYSAETIRQKLDDSIEASKKFQSRYEEGSEIWKRFQKAISEKKALKEVFSE